MLRKGGGAGSLSLDCSDGGKSHEEGKKEDETRRVGSQRVGRFNRSHRGNKGEEGEECSGMRRVSPRRLMIKTQTWKKNKNARKVPLSPLNWSRSHPNYLDANGEQ